MRTFIKVVLILAAVVLVVGGSFYFAMTRLGPPHPVENVNEHVRQAKKAIANILSSPDMDMPNRYFFKANHLVAFLDDNHLLSAEESDQLKAEMVDRYATLLAKWSLERFGAPTWYGEDLTKMRKSITMVKAVKQSDGKQVLSNSEASGQIEQVVDILDDYRAARSLTRVGKYESVRSSERLIEKASTYKNAPYLSNNVDLRRELDSVPRRLHNAHLRYLEGRVEHMKHYRWMDSMENVDKLYNQYSDEITEYDAVAQNVYGYHNNVAGLRRQLDDYHKEADDYYNPPQSSGGNLFDVFF